MMPGAWTSLRDAYFKPCGRVHWCVCFLGGPPPVPYHDQFRALPASLQVGS